MPTVSPAGRDRAKRHDQALDDNRQATGADRNRAAADSRTQPALSDEEPGAPQHQPAAGQAMTAHRTLEEQAAVDQAAAEAVALVAASYAAELAGRPLTRRQRDLQTRAGRLARAFTRADRRAGRP
jgi:hypothetical protein